MVNGDKTFDKSRQIHRIICFELKEEGILLVSSVHAWIVERDFLKPNWQFEKIFILLQKKSKRLWTIFSKIFENTGTMLIGR